MVIVLDENNNITLTEKAFLIKEFRDMFNYYTTYLKNPDRCSAAFGVLYYMYHFDSDFLEKYPDEEERFNEIRKFLYKGSEITKIKVFLHAMDKYKSLTGEDQTFSYIVMKSNFKKLTDYANRMVLTASIDNEDNINNFAIVVDYKEFAAINSLIPKQQEELRLFKEKLKKHMNSEIDVYGGKSLGAYE